MSDNKIIWTGAIGTVIAAVCCFTPALVILLGALGLAAWLTQADYIAMAALIVCLALVGFGLYRGRLQQKH